MKLTFILLTAAFLQVSAKGLSQNVTLTLKDAPIEKVFREIEKQTGVGFLYTQKMLQDAPTVDINVRNMPLNEVLQYCFKGQLLEYSIRKNTIVVKRKPEAAPVVIPLPPVITVSGRVTDETGRPVASVSVVIPGTPFGAMTKDNGEYSIANAPEKAKLFFSYIGYQSQTVDINGRSLINIVLKLEVRQLDETVVIAYGTTTRRKSTGSIASVTAEEIAKQPVGNVLNSLQGKVAGAIITQANGLPGSRVTVQIRGRSSLDNGQQPLYIIDGVPYGMQDQSTPATNDLNGYGLFAANSGISVFSLLNPADIERIDILKDADATAIYGTRGANGVVLITTKKGKAGKTKVDLNIYQGTGKTSHYVDVMNTQQYLQMRRQAYANDGLIPNTANAPDLLVWDTTQNTDWQRKYLGGTANTTDIQTTVSGGDARTRFLFGTGYHKETTVFPGDFNDTRYSVRFSADHNSLDRKFNASVSASYSFDKAHLPSSDLATRVYNLPPNMPLYKADGTLFWNTSFTNPEAYLLQNYFGRTSSLLSNVTLKYTLFKGLELKTTAGFNRITADQNQQNPVLSKNPITTTPTNSANFATLDQQMFIIEPQAVYTRNIGEGKLTALVGSTFQQSVNKGTSISADNFSNPGLLGTISGAGLYSSVTASYTLYKYNSIFSRLNYEWQNKYLLNAVVRRDGSSRFGANYRFGNFWSVGGGWIFSNEKMIAKALPFLSFGKIRGSYGLTGSDQLSDYQYLTLFTAASGTSGYQGSSTLSPNRVNNPGLHWETNKKMEFGLDLGFLKDRIGLTTNYYRNRTGNQLGFLVLSSQSGFNSYRANFDAEIQNTGWEFELNTTNFSTKDFEWKTSFNLTIPTTKLISASPQYFFYNKAVLGKPLSSIFRFTYKGVDPLTGLPLYKDATKDSLTFLPNFSTDRSIVGYTAPQFYGGINNTFSYKGFELSFFFQFTKREGDVLPDPFPGPGALSAGNQLTAFLNAWQKSGDVTQIPKYSTNSNVYSNYGLSSAIWGDASFARLRNATISYTFDKKLADKVRMSSCRIYLQGQNLHTWTKNKYASDPETAATVSQSTVVSTPLRVFTFGINCSF